MDWMEADNRAIIEIQKRSVEKTTVLNKISQLLRRTPRSRPGKLCTERKHKEKKSTPENVRVREEAAARCTANIKRRVLGKQARKASAEHLVKCSLVPGKKKTKSKPLTELYVKGHFTEDRERNGKNNRHCEEVYTDLEETKGAQERRIELFIADFQRRAVTQKSQLTWCCRPGPN